MYTCGVEQFQWVLAVEPARPVEIGDRINVRSPRKNARTYVVEVIEWRDFIIANDLRTGRRHRAAIVRTPYGWRDVEVPVA